MKTSIYIATSLDGFIARENGELDWLPGPEEKDNTEDYGFQDYLDSIDAIVMGRNTYEMVISFGEWLYGKKRFIVLSTKHINIPDHLADFVENKNCSPKELVEELKMDGIDHVYVDGGKTIQGFLNAGLINEIIISRIPVLIGQGIPLFGHLAQDIKLRLIETRSFKNGIVQSKYEVVK